MKKKMISAGVIITNGKDGEILLCHPTGTRHYDLPKGKIDDGELSINAAVRELREETGLIIHGDQLVYLGEFDYRADKMLSLYIWKVDQMPNINSLKCESSFTDKNGIARFEMDGFIIVKWSKIKSKVVPNMYKVLEKVRKLI